MASSRNFPLNSPFKPAPALVTNLTVNLILFYLFILCFTAFPLFLTVGFDPLVSVLVMMSLIVIFLLFLIWVKLYYVSMWYELREDEMSWKRGVWFHTTGIVPYNRITNLDIKQGPVMRYLGISTLAIQTAGYSGQAVPEIRIEGMVQAEELRELLRSMVRQSGTHSDGTGGVPITQMSTHQQMLEELVKIRTLLEQQKR